MLQYEMACWEQHFVHVAGVDEAGRGCLFGDVVAAAVIMPQGVIIDGIDDSKKLSEKKRDLLYDIICRQAISISVGTVHARVIDKINIKQASRLAMKKAVEGLAVQPDYILIDAEEINTDIDQLSIVKGDQLSQSIAAASIVAKVTRDRMCLQWDRDFPNYGIAKHKGYGTKLHRELIKEHGASELHRKSFLKNLL